MKKIIFSFVAIIFTTTPLFADRNPFETISESKQRHQAERYVASRDNSDNPFYESHGTFGDPGGDSSYRRY